MMQYIKTHYPIIAEQFKQLKSNQQKSRLNINSQHATMSMVETPWLLLMQRDDEKLNALASLFSENILKNTDLLAYNISTYQLKNGAFSWFKSGPENLNISIRVLEILGKVYQLDENLLSNEMENIAKKLINYLDNSFNAHKQDEFTTLNYLYARSLWHSLHPISKQNLDGLKSSVNKTLNNG